MTRVGRCSRSMSQAVVADLPVPVAPSRTTSCSPARIRRSSSSIAAGWSPEGSKSATTSNFPVLGVMSDLTRIPQRYERPTTISAVEHTSGVTEIEFIDPQHEEEEDERAAPEPERTLPPGARAWAIPALWLVAGGLAAGAA